MIRRLRIIPFLYKPTVVDTHLKEKLFSEASEIFRWAIDGCVEWINNGMTTIEPPQCVLEATCSYFESQDMITAWINECCEIGTAYSTSVKDLYNSYTKFCAENKTECVSSRSFGRKLNGKSFDINDTKVFLKSAKGSKGIRVIDGIKIN